MSDYMDIARDLAALGYFVFPVAERGKTPLTARGFKDATRDERKILHMWDRSPSANIGIDLGRSGVFAVDMDPKYGVDPVEVIADLGLDAAAMVAVHTGEAPERDDDLPDSLAGVRGMHLYFAGVYPTRATPVYGVEVRGAGGYVVAPGSVHASGVQYMGSLPRVEDLPTPPPPILALLRSSEVAKTIAPRVDGAIPQGLRNGTLASFAGTMRRRGMAEGAIFAALMVENARCDPPLPDDEVRTIAYSVARYAPAAPPPVAAPNGDGPHVDPDPDPDPEHQVKTKRGPWPAPLADAGFHGPLGQIARAIEPETEADVAAVLVQLLVGFGNLVGRGPGIQREGDFHPTNLFALVVGRTSLARKGTSWGRVNQVLAQLDPDWTDERVQSGISSGEGLVHAVRDLRRERRPAKTKDERERADDDELVEEVVDPGVKDKRLLVREGDFDRALHMIRREGNVLSDTLRSLWDSGRNGGLTKTNPETVRNAHVSVVGHITVQQIEARLDKGEIANGFINRFLVVCAKRARSLPHGGNFDMGEVVVHLTALRKAKAEANDSGAMAMTGPAMRLWEQVYDGLNIERPEPLGDVLARAPAQVLRLAVVYAVADRARFVDEVHVRAALAVWDYCEASAAHVFGGSLGDPRAARIHASLLAASDRGLSKADVWTAAGSNNIPVTDLNASLGILVRRGLAHCQMVPTKGRPAERWYADPGEKGGAGGNEDLSSHENPLSSQGDPDDGELF